VNFMLDRLGSRRPLEPGMRVLDPACGSGAFLVQCYRKLIEQHIRGNPGERPKPTELRRLLIDHIFGADTDEDACQIAELSLSSIGYNETEITCRLARINSLKALRGGRKNWLLRMGSLPWCCLL